MSDEPELRRQIAVLSEALRDHWCLADGNMKVGQCVDAGHCGCSTGLILKAYSPVPAPSPPPSCGTGEAT